MHLTPTDTRPRINLRELAEAEALMPSAVLTPDTLAPTAMTTETAKHKTTPPRTWGDLLADLQRLTPEQLARTAIAVHDDGMFNEVFLHVTTERHYEVELHEEWLPESEALEGLDREDLDKCDFREAGEVYLILD